MGVPIAQRPPVCTTGRPRPQTLTQSNCDRNERAAASAWSRPRALWAAPCELHLITTYLLLLMAIRLRLIDFMRLLMVLLIDLRRMALRRIDRRRRIDIRRRIDLRRIDLRRIDMRRRRMDMRRRRRMDIALRRMGIAASGSACNEGREGCVCCRA